MNGPPVRRNTQLGWSLIGGVIFALGTLASVPIAGIEIGGVGPEGQGQVTWLTLLLGTFLTGSFCWWLLVARPHRLSLRRGAVAGVAVGLLSYPVVLALAEFTRSDAAYLSTGLAERALNVLKLTVLAIATSGFAATAVMALVGIAAALLLRPVYPRLPARERRPERGPAWKALTGLALALVVLLTGGFAWLSLLPLHEEQLAKSRIASQPAASYEQAMQRYAAIQASEAGLDLNPLCLSKLLTHGTKVEKVVIFFHGLTNCPAQLDKLAPKLFAAGYNVYVPRLPGHGEKDPMTEALVDLTAEEMVGTAEAAIDLAQGLGNEVYVSGLSGGGNMTMWAAQNRGDVAHSVALAPFIGPHVVPTWANRAAANLLLLLPSVMFTWNPLEPNGPPGMEYAYPRVPTHALGQFMRLGEIVLDEARRTPPAARGLGILVSNADFAVNNRLALQVASAWEGQGRKVDVEVVPLSKGIIHDMIDPRQPDQNTDFVYALFLDMLQRHSAATP